VALAPDKRRFSFARCNRFFVPPGAPYLSVAMAHGYGPAPMGLRDNLAVEAVSEFCRQRSDIVPTCPSGFARKSLAGRSGCP
jgi:hypothetical protein